MAAAGQAEQAVMRAIEARERKVALRERREAIVAHAARTAPQPGQAGWSAKPDRKRKASPVPVNANRALWARRHPDRAKSERELRVSRVEALKRWDHKREGTTETHENFARTREGSLARLYASGAIDADQVNAAVEIATVVERIGADVAIRTASLETRIDQSGWRAEAIFVEGLERVRHEVAYTRWRNEVVKLGPLAAVLAMIVGETVGPTVIAKRYGMHNRRAKRLLISALELWRSIASDVFHELDPATINAAQAGIL